MPRSRHDGREWDDDDVASGRADRGGERIIKGAIKDLTKVSGLTPVSFPHRLKKHSDYLEACTQAEKRVL
eukprot:901984-Alexandrium_andersonii.AAC.1